MNGSKMAAFVGAIFLLSNGPGAVAPAQALLPTGDLQERFDSDPRADFAWDVQGAWTWDGAAKTFVSGTAGTGTALWAAGDHYAGTIAARLKLVTARPGAPARARVIFARDRASGAFRYVQLTAGNPGTVILGQSGTIGGKAGGTIKKFQRKVPRNTWLNLGVAFAGNERVTVSLGGKALFTTTVAPLAPGEVGISSVGTKAVFDSLSFVANPDGEPCRDCHAGQAEPQLAKNVYTYWDGSWWDSTQGGGPSQQQGGHGDPGGQFAMNCTGGAGCHDMRLPAVGDHRNGVHERVENQTVNPLHLRAPFIPANPGNAWAVQTTFDDFCATACHQGFNIRDMRHLGVSGARPYLQLGYGSTDALGRSIPADVPLDNDLSSLASASSPLFATCVTCHDPHGTGVTDQTHGSNHMVRMNYVSESTLCLICHT